MSLRPARLAIKYNFNKNNRMLKSLKGTSQLVPNGLKRVGSLANFAELQKPIPTQSQLGYLQKLHPPVPNGQETMQAFWPPEEKRFASLTLEYLSINSL